ncbi:glycosidase [Candidatus Pacearchaeota archaeon CG10_big_fil_rev_8_21_14_0_10_34_76]|nr:MAG: glycosidase [Candidatus Pacearchaeota archaeon CG10_big_fil_rev_8_21_14_0_10_34_76]
MNIKGNLLLKPEDFKPSLKNWSVTGILNPAAIRMPNGKIMLYVRVAENASHKHGKKLVCPIMVHDRGSRNIKYQEIHEKDITRKGVEGEVFLKEGLCRLPTISHFRRVILSKSGLKVEKIDQRAAFLGRKNDGDFGVEDPRIVKIGDRYYMTYVGVSMFEGISTYLAVSNDLEKWERRGLIFREQNKDVALFPEIVNGEYVALNRPESTMHFTKPGIWISYSKDLVYWGKDKNLMRPRENSWEGERIGGGCPPIKLKEGWLMIYHGVKSEKNEESGEDENIYSAGAVLLDLKNPEKIIARSPKDTPLMKPEAKLEKFGFINNVVFPTGVVPDGRDNLLVYYGGADSYIFVRKFSIKSILKHMKFY